jgi:hypothetical protein
MGEKKTACCNGVLGKTMSAPVAKAENQPHNDKLKFITTTYVSIEFAVLCSRSEVHPKVSHERAASIFS